MKSLATLTNLYTTLANNLSSDNQALGIQLMTDAQRYTLEKYFDNETSVTTTTVGSQNLTATATLSIGDTSATLTASWSFPTGYAPTTFSSGENRNVLYTNGSASITWSDALTSTATTAISCLGFQFYNIPANISKITNDTITIGQLKFTPIPIQTRSDWDRINFLPYNSDIPAYYFIYNGQLGIFPIPSTTGNILTFNYKAKVPNFSTSFLFSDTSGTAYIAGQTVYDYQKGTISGATVGSTSITGTSTSWNTTGKFPLNVDVTPYNLYLVINPPYGDGIAYPITKFTSDTALTLGLPIVNTMSISSATYSIGQYPKLTEDFHDMLAFNALMTYYSTIVPSEGKFKQFEVMYKSRLDLMEDYIGTKQVDVDLGREPQQVNPNLFIYNNT